MNAPYAVVILLLILSCFSFCAHRFAKPFKECQRSDPISCWQNRGTCNQDPPLKTIQPGSPIREDTFGQLIANQMLWRLPGIDFMTMGFNIFKGTSEFFPIFLFCYQYASNITRRLQDTYRGNTYIIPDEVYAAASPMCSYTMDSKSYSSAQAYASSMMVETGVSADIEASYSKLGFSASARVAFSQESSVSAAMSVQQKQSGSIAVTQASCETIKIQLEDVDFTSFHPRFVHDVFEASTTNEYYNLIKKYGTHYMTSAIMGGKLVQISSTSSSFIHTKSEKELKERREASFSASASGWGISGSAAGQYSSSHSGKSKEQNEYESKTEKSSIISYGGAAGSFGPSKESSSTASWGDWAKTVDLVPVPIKYSLRLISDIIPPEWKNKNEENIKKAWTEALASYWKEEELKLLKERLGQNVYIITITTGSNIKELVGPYSFKLGGMDDITNFEYHFFTKRFQLNSNPVSKILRFTADSTYTMKVQQPEVISFSDIRTFVLCDMCHSKGIEGVDMGETSPGKINATPLEKLDVKDVTIADTLNGKVYYYDLRSKHPGSGCYVEHSVEMPRSLRILFNFQDITNSTYGFILKFSFTGTLGKCDYYTTTDQFKPKDDSMFMATVNCDKDIGYITSLSMQIVINDFFDPPNLLFKIDGSSLLIIYSDGKNAHMFESTSLLVHEFDNYTPVTFGIKTLV